MEIIKVLYFEQLNESLNRRNGAILMETLVQGI